MLGPNTFSSLKHSVSIICKKKKWSMLNCKFDNFNSARCVVSDLRSAEAKGGSCVMRLTQHRGFKYIHPNNASDNEPLALPVT